MSAGESKDTNDPSLILERRWGGAITEWMERDGTALAALVRDASQPTPDFAREFLADLVAGTVTRGKGGRPVVRHGRVERSIVAAVFSEWDATSKELACEKVAEGRRITPDAVRGVVDRLRKLGITRERWHKWGRPDWGNR